MLYHARVLAVTEQHKGLLCSSLCPLSSQEAGGVPETADPADHRVIPPDIAHSSKTGGCPRVATAQRVSGQQPAWERCKLNVFDHLLMFLPFPITYYTVLISTHSFLSISLPVLSSIPLGVSEWLWETPLMPEVIHHRDLNPEKTNRNFYFSGFQVKRNQHRVHSQNSSVTKNTDPSCIATALAPKSQQLSQQRQQEAAVTVMTTV